MKTYAIHIRTSQDAAFVPYIGGFETHEQASAVAEDLNSQRLEGDTTEYVVVPAAEQEPQPAILPAVIPPLLRTQKGKLSVATKNAIDWALRQSAPANSFRRVEVQGGGRYTKNVIKGDAVAMLLRANGFDPKLKNDAPRGGAIGDYYLCEGWEQFINALVTTYTNGK